MDQIVDDSVFSLILRFAGFNQKVSFHDEDFLKKQHHEIEAYVNQYPPEERREHILKWIEQYARDYRNAWRKEIVTKEVSDYRCPDCPLCNDNSHKHCVIHDQWVELLQRYVAGEINSQKYVDEVLTLLDHHKEELKNKLSTLSLLP